jgi:4Fe-4S ferredoxin
MSGDNLDVLITSQEIKEDKVVLRRRSALKERVLSYSKKLCTGCGMCVETCPISCIELNPVSTVRGIVSQPGIVVDPEKCFLCGICSEVCLFNAIELLEDGNPIKFLDGNPRFSLIYDIDEKKCPAGCKECEIACPRKAIRCLDGEKTIVAREAEKCIYCTSCKIACPENAIVVEKVFSGEISIDLEKCQACGICVSVCPSKAIEMPEPEFGKEVEQIKLIEERCIYCKACENGCPLKAISVRRKSINYSVSGKNPWTKTHEEAFKKLIG